MPRSSKKPHSEGEIDRRSFLSISAAAAGGLLVSLYLDLPATAQEGNQAPPPKVYPPDAFVHIRPDGQIAITVNRLEFGQGVHTSLPMILADEMDADWSQVVAEPAPAADVYKDPLFGIQMVGGSGSIAHSFQQYRELGAKTRAMLIVTAADRWHVTPDQCRAAKSVVYGPGNQSARYGELANDAARKPVPAKQARDRLKIDWDLSGIDHPDSSELQTRYKELARTTGNVAVNRGDDKALDRIADNSRIIAEYEFPYLAHTPMEPLNATVRFDGDRAEAWVPSQFQTMDQMAIAEVLGLKPEQVTFHTEFAGGGFGRRAVIDSHVPREAAVIAKRLRGTPVKLIWTREDDVRGGYYRPMHAHRVEIGIGREGLPAAWRHVIVCQSIVAGTPFAVMLIKNGVDQTTVEGTSDTSYNIPNFHVSAHNPTVNVPVLWWRSVGHTHTAFVMETLIDELATRAKMDPIIYRRRLLKPDAKKLRSALDLLDEKSASWRNKLPKGHALGVSCHECFGTAVACAVDVSIENKRPKIHRATVAVNCGLAVNPLTVESQFQAGVGVGVTQLMAKGAITFKDGRVEQRNFDGYTPPYIVDAPVDVDVHIVPSTDPPTGCGEPPVPVISPAVVNALAKLTGKRYRSLPLASL